MARATGPCGHGHGPSHAGVAGGAAARREARARSRRRSGHPSPRAGPYQCSHGYGDRGRSAVTRTRDSTRTVIRATRARRRPAGPGPVQSLDPMSVAFPRWLQQLLSRRRSMSFNSGRGCSQRPPGHHGAAAPADDFSFRWAWIWIKLQLDDGLNCKHDCWQKGQGNDAL